MINLKGSSIVAQGVAFAYGKRKVLEDFNLRIEPGEFFCLLGPSGSGKTTFLRIVAGLEQPQRGSVQLDNVDVLSTPPEARRVGMVFQGLGLWPHMNVRQHVEYGLLRKGAARDEIDAKVEYLLNLMGLRDCALAMSTELSGGQQQKVAIARSLVVEPQVLLLDQPMSALDPPFRTQMRRELQLLQRKLGITTILVTHDQEEALGIADRVAVMRHGRIEQIGSPTALYDYPRTASVAVSVGVINLINGGVREGLDDFPSFYSSITGSVSLPDALHRPAPGPAVMCFRPSAVQILPYDKLDQDADSIWMNGVIRQAEFHGSHVRYLIDVADTALVSDAPHRIGALPLPQGADVLLAVERSQIRYLPGEDAQSLPPASHQGVGAHVFDDARHAP